MNKTLIWIIVGVLVLVGGLFVLKQTGALGKDEGTKVSAEKAELRTIIETVNASGKVYPEIEVKVSPDISGEIIELMLSKAIVLRRDRCWQEFTQIFMLRNETRQRLL